ncbi:MAG TPA: family 43 glycosylhydrolase [Bacilli bacterium]|nr:family 43 glycosylhydrolase [Bacilli bacterium]
MTKNKMLLSLLMFLFVTGCTPSTISSKKESSEHITSQTEPRSEEEESSTVPSTSEDTTLNTTSEETTVISTSDVPLSSEESESEVVTSSEEDPVTSSEPTVPIEYARAQYQNVLYANGEFADPTIAYDEEENAYYLFATGGKMLKSYDLVKWYSYGNAFSSTPNWGTPGAGLWAPDVTKVGDLYVMYYSLSTWGDSNPGIGIATAERPGGPWVDRGELFRSQAIGVNNSIDAHAFVAQTGQVYLVWGSMRGNYIVELTSDGLAFKGGSVEWARFNKTKVAGLDTTIGWSVGTYEGAYMLYKDGYYYLMLSTGTCCDGVNSSYKVVTGRSTSPTGPFYDKNNRDMNNEFVGHLIVEGNEEFFGPGHHTVLQDQKGNYFMYYHTYTPEYTNYRVLILDELHFDSEGWPYVTGHVPSNYPKPGPYYRL